MPDKLDCTEFRETILEGRDSAALRRHLSECESCREAMETQREILAALQPGFSVTASDSFQERVMKAIHQEQIAEKQETTFARRRWFKWVPVAAAAALLLAIPLVNSKRPGQPPNGASLLAQSAGALSKVSSVHLQGRIRTLPGDNFELIGAEYEFVPIELWREYANPPRWRVEKPGRAVAMDGHSTTMYIQKSNTATRGGTKTGYIDWLKPLLDPASVVEKEMRAANAGESRLLLMKDTAGSRTVSIERDAKGDFRNAWALNRSIQEAKSTCTYRFDSATGLLTALTVAIETPNGPVTVAEFDRIIYNEPMPASLFALTIPADAAWSGTGVATKDVPNFAGPKETAVFFFDALANEDWDAAAAVNGVSRLADPVRRTYGGIQVVSIGEPFQSGLYRGWFVPYEIKMPDGRTKKWNLAVRNDNPQHRWKIDGGY